MQDVTTSEDRILRLLKFRGPQATPAIARHLKITLPGARKHLAALLDAKLVSFADEAGKVGRPRRTWRLTPLADGRFPDSHAVLTLEMIAGIRSVFGEDGLDRLIGARESETEARYGAALSGLRDMAKKVARLAELRSEEGYMADWQALPDGSYLLAENHCPICAAARICQGFCRSELAVFRRALGEDVTVERAEHILAGARRCAYKIGPKS
ncbi:helix-turn-helix transcriptional regulator [Taklimakanibacter lacteus]|uniref:helix-turn-helix transcriptional regulator n=1 Tax=Taklimakanibacter lacteus TaxID=2268456 RepID=UPI000E675CB9